MNFLTHAKYLAVGVGMMFMGFCAVVTLWVFYDLALKYFSVEYFLIAGFVAIFLFTSYNLGLIFVQMKDFKDRYRDRP